MGWVVELLSGDGHAAHPGEGTGVARGYDLSIAVLHPAPRHVLSRPRREFLRPHAHDEVEVVRHHRIRGDLAGEHRGEEFKPPLQPVFAMIVLAVTTTAEVRPAHAAADRVDPGAVGWVVEVLSGDGHAAHPGDGTGVARGYDLSSSPFPPQVGRS